MSKKYIYPPNLWASACWTESSPFPIIRRHPPTHHPPSTTHHPQYNTPCTFELLSPTPTIVYNL